MATYLELQKEELKPAQALCVASSLHLASVFILQVNNSNARLPISTCMVHAVPSVETFVSLVSAASWWKVHPHCSSPSQQPVCPSRVCVQVAMGYRIFAASFPFRPISCSLLFHLPCRHCCDWLTATAFSDISKGVDETYPQQKLRMISKQISRLPDQQRFIFLALIKKDVPIVLLKEYAPTGPEGLLPASIYYIC